MGCSPPTIEPRLAGEKIEFSVQGLHKGDKVTVGYMEDTARWGELLSPRAMHGGVLTEDFKPGVNKIPFKVDRGGKLIVDTTFKLKIPRSAFEPYLKAIRCLDAKDQRAEDLFGVEFGGKSCNASFSEGVVVVVASNARGSVKVIGGKKAKVDREGFARVVLPMEHFINKHKLGDEDAQEVSWSTPVTVRTRFKKKARLGVGLKADRREIEKAMAIHTQSLVLGGSRPLPWDIKANKRDRARTLLVADQPLKVEGIEEAFYPFFFGFRYYGESPSLDTVDLVAVAMPINVRTPKKGRCRYTVANYESGGELPSYEEHHYDLEVVVKTSKGEQVTRRVFKGVSDESCPSSISGQDMQIILGPKFEPVNNWLKNVLKKHRMAKSNH